MGAALAMAEALGVPARAAAELLPAIEAAMARHLNRRVEEAGDDAVTPGASR